MKIAFHTFGCKLNQAETDDLKKALIKKGFILVDGKNDPDIVVIRACAVTCGASQTTRETIRRYKKNGAYVVATGCLEDKLPEIDFIAENNDIATKHLLMKFEPKLDVETGFTEERTRAFIKIQTGCNFDCSYRIIPHFRGRTQSIDKDIIIKKILEAEQNGYLEVVLTGVNICQYNKDGVDLPSLLSEILLKTKIPRIRLGSLDPRLINARLIDIFLSNANRLLPHWHLSLQSGSDKILKAMGRYYTANKYLETINKLREKNPAFSFTTDIIVGFPGENEQDFEDTCELVKKVSFSKIHVFPYSKRPKTLAAELKDQVQDKTKTERARILRELGEKITKGYANNFIGTIRPVLFENSEDGYSTGYTPEYLRVKIEDQTRLCNQIRNIEIKRNNLIF